MRLAERSIGGERLGRFGFICVPSASRGDGVERAATLTQRHERLLGTGNRRVEFCVAPAIVGAFYLRKISGSFAMLADPPRLVLREQLGRRASPRLILVNRPIVPRRRRRYSHEKAAIKSR